MSPYFDALTAAMTETAGDERVLVMGQSVAYGGQRAFDTFAGVPISRRVEMPIAENNTVGQCFGYALAGFVPLCFLPRWDFLIIAADQLVNHVDKCPWPITMIIRTAVGTTHPLDPGPQHTGNYSAAFQKMLPHVSIVELHRANQIVETYRWARERVGVTIAVEFMELY